jgi:hypothetical protein
MLNTLDKFMGDCFGEGRPAMTMVNHGGPSVYASVGDGFFLAVLGT